jgi:hypothetical protein
MLEVGDRAQRMLRLLFAQGVEMKQSKGTVFYVPAIVLLVLVSRRNQSVGIPKGPTIR